jgi:Tol biopolymer transport system component
VRRGSRAGAVAAALIALATAAPASAQQARIAYSSHLGLRTIAADGSDMRQLTNTGDELGDAEPAFSPDGQSVAFVRHALAEDHDHDDDQRVWIVRGDGTEPRPVTARPSARRYESGPAFSPDGRHLAFAQLRVGRTGVVASIVVVDLADGTRRAVHSESGEDDEPYSILEQPAWSPSGDSLLFTRSTLGDEGPDFRPSIHVVPAAGGEARRLVVDASHGTWSPDGARIAYSAIHDRLGERCAEECVPSGELYVANADGSNPTRLTTSRADDADPSWSGDGERIAFSSDRNTRRGEGRDGPRELYSVRPDGSCLTWLTNGTADSAAPAFQPGRGLSSDPGGCGPGPREPLVETDTTKLESFKRFPVWWLGRVAPNGLMLGDAFLGSRLVSLAYDDCSHFDPDACGDPLDVTTWDLCTPGRHFEVDHGRNRFSLFRGALLHVHGDDELGETTLYTHRLRVALATQSGRAAGTSVVDVLRPVGGERTPGAAFPSARLPRDFWRQISRVTELYRRLGSSAAVAKRLHLQRSVVVQRLAVGRRLAQLGVKRRLGC